MKSNMELKREVEDEFRGESSLIGAEIVVSVEDGIVMLTGLVESLLQKKAAIWAVKQVIGVRALLVKIMVKSQESSYEAIFVNPEHIFSAADENMIEVTGAQGY